MISENMFFVRCYFLSSAGVLKNKSRPPEAPDEERETLANSSQSEEEEHETLANSSKNEDAEHENPCK